MKQLALGSAGLVVAIMVVNASNYGLNMLLANTLEPSVFGDASLMVTVLLVSGVLAATLQLATSVAVLKAPEQRDRQVSAMRLLANRLGLFGGLLLAVSSPLFSKLLQVDSSWALVVMAAGFPIHLQLAVERGRVQGDLRLGRLALTFVAEGVARVVASLLALAISPDVTTLAIALNLGFVSGYWICRPRVGRWSWLDLASPKGHPPIGSVGVAVVAVTLITNLDIVAAKAVFDPTTAGSFAALALGGRVVFFASWTLQQALLPLVIADHPTLTAVVRRRLFLAGNALICAALVAVGWIWAELWVGIAFGDSYPEVAPLFGPYALGTGLISIVAALAVIRSATGDQLPGRLMLVGSIGASIVLLCNGSTLDAFVDARLITLVMITAVVLGARQISNRLPQRFTQACRSDLEGAFS